MFLKMSQNSQENICVESFDNRPEDVQLCKKRLQLKCFPVKIAKFLRIPILKNICYLQQGVFNFIM